MKRVRRLLIWSGCVVIVLLGLAYFAMDYGVDRVLRSMQSIEATHDGVEKRTELSVDAEDEPGEYAGVDDEIGQELSIGDVSNDRDDSPEQGSENDSTTEVSDGEAGAYVSDGADASDGEAGTDVGNKVEARSAPVSGDDPEPYTGEITPEKIETAEEKITFREKTKVTSTLLRRLSASDIRRLSSMSSMTIEEKKEAKALFLEKLSEEEYDELIAIAAKLGLSRGQTYAESIGM